MFDVGAETGDKVLVAACRSVWTDAVTRKMYITSAMGRSSDEEFTEPFALNNRASTGKGCQSAALVRLSHRLLLEDRDAKYADVIERVIYNNLAANISLDGRRFYYVNRLSARPEDATGRPYIYPYHETVRERLSRFCLDRQPWFQVPCCPPNVAMTIATLGRYAYARSDSAIYVNLYLGNRAEFEMAGAKVRLRQRTRYPWDGRVRVEIDADAPRPFDLHLRIPNWCRELESTGELYRIEHPTGNKWLVVKVNGQVWPVEVLEKGYLRLPRTWHNGDVIELDLPMEVLRIGADPRVAADAGQSALQRGPMVYCFEAADHDGSVHNLRLPDDAAVAPRWRPDLLGGVVVLGAKAVAEGASGSRRIVPLTAIPYAVWCNRQPGEMDVWIGTQ